MSLSSEGLTEWSPPQHERHRPEAALLYQIVEEYWPSFQAELDSQGKSLPHFVAKEFDEYLKCGRLEHGFLRVKARSTSELNSLVAKISQRIARHLEKQGLLTRDDENSYLTMDGLDDNVMNELQGSAKKTPSTTKENSSPALRLRSTFYGVYQIGDV